MPRSTSAKTSCLLHTRILNVSYVELDNRVSAQVLQFIVVASEYGTCAVTVTHTVTHEVAVYVP